MKDIILKVVSLFNLSLNITNQTFAFLFLRDKALDNNFYLRVNKACQEKLECQEKEVLENLVLRYIVNRGIVLFIYLNLKNCRF